MTTASYQPSSPPQSLAATCADRLNHFVRHNFDPKSARSFEVADLLWRATLMARDAERVQVQQ